MGEGEGRGGKEGSWKSFSAHFIAFHFAAVTQGLPRGLPKRKLSAQFEILLRQVFPSITQRGVAPAPLSLSLPLVLMLPQVTQGGKPPSALCSAPAAASTAATSHFLLPNPCPAALHLCGLLGGGCMGGQPCGLATLSLSGECLLQSCSRNPIPWGHAQAMLTGQIPSKLQSALKFPFLICTRLLEMDMVSPL